MVKLTATLPDGTKVTRETKHAYKFVVCGKVRPNDYWASRGYSGKFVALQWTSRKDLAEKAVKKCVSWDDWDEVQYVPVDGTNEEAVNG